MATTNPFLTPLVEQVVPSAVSLKDKLTHAGVGQSRYEGLYTPITGGGSYSAGGSGTKLMTFKLTSSDYTDLSTLMLSLNVSPADGTAANWCIDESILCLFQQLTVRIGGVQLFTITDFPAVYNTLVSQAMPKAIYDNDGPAQGLYKSNPALLATAAVGGAVSGWQFNLTGGSVAGATGAYDDTAHLGARVAASSWLSQTGGKFYNVPLGFLFSGLSTYFPLRNVSNIEIEFLLQSSVNSCLVPKAPVGFGAAAPAGAPSQINVNEAEIRVDHVRCSPDLYALMDSEIREGSGVTLAMDLHTHIPFSQSAGSATVASEKALQTAQSIRFLKSISVITRPTAYLNDPTCSSANFGVHQFGQFRCLVNGMSYPQVPISKCWDAYQEAKKTQNKLGHLTGDSVTNYTNWLGPVGVQAHPVISGSRDGTWWGSAPVDDARFIPSVNFETFLTSRDSDLDGVNLAESAGSLVEVRITNAPATAVWSAAGTANPTAANATFGVILHHTGILAIRGGAVEFLK
jgi:hypothetical protein